MQTQRRKSLEAEAIASAWELFSATLFASAVVPAAGVSLPTVGIFAASLVASAFLVGPAAKRGPRGLALASAMRIVVWPAAILPVFETAGARGFIAAAGFGVMAAWTRRAVYARTLAGPRPEEVATDDITRAQLIARALVPRVAESAAVVGLVGGHVLLLFTVAFMRTESRQILDAWRDIVPLLGVVGTLAFTGSLRRATRAATHALEAGPEGPRAVLLRGLEQVRNLPDALALTNFAIWFACTTIGVFYFRTGPSSWAPGDAVMQILFTALLSFGVSFYQRAWHRDSTSLAVETLERWTGVSAPAVPLPLRRRMLRDFGLPLVFTVALSLLSAIGLYRAMGADLPLREDLAAISALFASFSILVLAVGGVVVRAARELSRPMDLVGEAADRVARGDLRAAVPKVDGPAEVVGLGASVERMRSALANTIAELEAERAGLEEKVANRTAELSNTLEELRRTQAALVHGERLASIGELVAGVAHEIKNPLNAIAGSTEPLARVVDELKRMLDAYRVAEGDLPEARRKALENLRRELDVEGALDDLSGISSVVRRATARSVSIVANLQSFARTSAEPEPASLEEGIEETLLLLASRLAKSRITVTKSFELKQNVVCHPGEMNQVFMNLFTNAMHALESVPESERRMHIATGLAGREAWASVEDNGPGVPEADAKRVFDPFFTTKPRGQGTGLGLSISTDILRRHGGTLSLEGVEPHGARFVCRLPLDLARAPRSLR